MPDHNYFANPIWQIDDLRHGPQYEHERSHPYDEMGPV